MPTYAPLPEDYARCTSTRWFKYDRDDLCVNKSQFVPVIFEPPCISSASRPGLFTLEDRTTGNHTVQQAEYAEPIPVRYPASNRIPGRHWIQLSCSANTRNWFQDPASEPSQNQEMSRNIKSSWYELLWASKCTEWGRTGKHPTGFDLLKYRNKELTRQVMDVQT